MSRRKQEQPHSVSDFAKEQVELDDLRTALAKERDKVDRLRRNRADLVAEFSKAVRSAMLEVKLPPVHPAKKDTRPKDGETAICVLSDWQLAKITPTYDSKIAIERLHLYIRKVVEKTNLYRNAFPVKHCNVYLIGDLIEGELIFPGQAHRIDSSLYRQIFVNGGPNLALAIRTLAANFETVHVEGVLGNHGALGGWVSGGSRYYHPETNADLFMYEVAHILTRDLENVTWSPNIVEKERKWYAVDRTHTGDHAFLIFHGDQIPTTQSWAGIPFYGFLRSLLGWRVGALHEPFTYSISGHWHVPFQIPYGANYTHWGNGSLESDNTYAQELRAGRRDPCQWLLYCHPKRGVTSEHKIWLTDADR